MQQQQKCNKKSNAVKAPKKLSRLQIYELFHVYRHEPRACNNLCLSLLTDSDWLRTRAMFRSILIQKWWVFNLLGAFCNCQTFFKCLISLSKSCKTIKKSKCYNSPSWHSHMQWLVLHFISITILLRELTNQTILTSGDNDDDCDAHYTCGGIRMFLDVIASLSTYPSQWVNEGVGESVMFSDFGDSYRIYRVSRL